MSADGGHDADETLFAAVREDDTHALWHLFRSYWRPVAPQFLFGAVAGIVSRGTELVPAFVLGIAIDTVLVPHGGQTPSFTLPFVPNAWLPTSTLGQLHLVVGLIAGAYLLGAVTRWANSWAWNFFSQHLQHAVRTDAYDAMQALELGFFDDRQTGEIMSVLNNDVNQLESFLTDRLNTGIRILVRVGGMSLVMLALNWQLALIPITLVPLMGIASYVFVTIIEPKYRTVRSNVGGLNSRLENAIGGIEVVKAANAEAYESDRVAEASRDYLEAQWDAITTRITFYPLLRLLTASGYVATLLVGGIWVLDGPPGPFSGSLTAGTLVTFLLYSRRFTHPMRSFGEVVDEYQYAEAASERIVGLLQKPRTIEESPDAVAIADPAGRVEYESVTFRYDESDEPVLSDVSFSIAPEEYVGVVGPTGAGKTTLLKLLMRLYDVEEGAVRIDGTDVRDLTLDSLRKHISYVSQEPFLFSGTVCENIAYGRPGVDDDRVREAARLAGAHEFVTDLPEGYDTTVGERGVKLSGGQRQRISLARAVLDDPAILVLDEATSHVDNETELLIQNNLEDLVADRTTFAIAHRLSTVRNADRILVLSDGDLVEDGTHEGLLTRDGLYANLWRVQVGELDALPQEFIDRTTRREANVRGTD